MQTPLVQAPGAVQLETAHVWPARAPAMQVLAIALQVELAAQRTDVSLLHRWSDSSPASACTLAIGPVTLQVPHGRWVAVQESCTVTSPPEMIGARCEIPVQPVSSTDVGAVESPEK